MARRTSLLILPALALGGCLRPREPAVWSLDLSGVWRSACVATGEGSYATDEVEFGDDNTFRRVVSTHRDGACSPREKTGESVLSGHYVLLDDVEGKDGGRAVNITALEVPAALRRCGDETWSCGDEGRLGPGTVVRSVVAVEGDTLRVGEGEARREYGRVSPDAAGDVAH